MTWLVPWEELDPDQALAVQLPTDRNYMLQGPPGSGKSIALVHRARELVDRGMDPERVRIAVYTNSLKQYISTGLEEVGLPTGMVVTFDCLCRANHSRVVGGRLPGAKNYRGQWELDHRRIRENLSVHLAEDAAPVYDAVLLDECQDIDRTGYRILRILAQHLTIAGDARQQLFTDMTLSDILREARAEEQPLNWGFRSTPEVMAVAGALGGFEGLEDAATPEPRDIPVLVRADSAEGEIEALVEALSVRLGNENERCAVVVPKRRLVERVVRILHSHGIDAEGQQEWDFGTDAVKVIPIPSAKGLTFTSVFMPFLNEGDWQGLHNPEESLLFVGASRASHWLHLSHTAGEGMRDLKRLEGMPQDVLAVLDR